MWLSPITQHWKLGPSMGARTRTALVIFLVYFTNPVDAFLKKNKCYSCASENMKENFLTRERGPPNRRAEPRLYDNMCDLDLWLLREKSMVECNGPCFKWQQIVNNSGVFSYATIRGCYTAMFGEPHADALAEANTRCLQSERALDCLDQSTIIEHTCWCNADYCNAAAPASAGLRRALLLALGLLVGGARLA